MATPAAPLVIDLGSSWGAASAGNYIAMALLAYQFAQTAYYLKNYREDRWSMKAIAILLLALSTAQQVEVTKTIWIITIRNYGNFGILLEQAPDTLAAVMLTATSTLVVQVYFLRRIFLFSEHRAIKWGVPVILVGPVIWQFIGCIVYTVKAAPLDATGEASLRFLDMSIQVCTAVVDVAIAVVMSALLFNRRTGMNSNEELITHLVVASVNSGIWTAILSFINVVLIITVPGTLWYTITYLPLCALYGNSLLGNWNGRNTARAISARGASGPSVGSGSAGQGSQPIAMTHLSFASTDVGARSHPDIDIYGKTPARGYDAA